MTQLAIFLCWQPPSLLYNCECSSLSLSLSLSHPNSEHRGSLIVQRFEGPIQNRLWIKLFRYILLPHIPLFLIWNLVFLLDYLILNVYPLVLISRLEFRVILGYIGLVFFGKDTYFGVDSLKLIYSRSFKFTVKPNTLEIHLFLNPVTTSSLCF